MSTILNLSISRDPAAVRQLSPATLAFVGDAAYGLCVRERLAQQVRKSGELHRLSVYFVKAAAQAQAYRTILPFLSEEEDAVFKRGRNFHTNHSPKSATAQDYHMATGLETLFGYLYLSGKNERLSFLFSQIWEEIQDKIPSQEG